VLAVSYFSGLPGVAAYQIEDGSRLVGEWTVAGAGGELFSETLIKMPAEALEQRQRPLRSQPPSSSDDERAVSVRSLQHQEHSSSDASDPLPPFLTPSGSFGCAHSSGNTFHWRDLVSGSLDSGPWTLGLGSWFLAKQKAVSRVMALVLRSRTGSFCTGRWMEVPVHIDDLFNPVNKLTESARRVIDRALEDSRRREHAVLTSAHLLFAVAQAEWDRFAQAMRDANVSPHAVLRSLHWSDGRSTASISRRSRRARTPLAPDCT